jgi:uncharacterized spore protein YtfJ
MVTETTELVRTLHEEAGNGHQKAQKAAEPSASDQLVDRLIERIGGRAGVEAAFGTPVERGEVTVIPVARVRWAFGAGGGTPPVTPDQPVPGAGSGAGGMVGVEPIGYLEIKASGSTFTPISDSKPSPLFLLAAGVMVSMMLRGIARVIPR